MRLVTTQGDLDEIKKVRATAREMFGCWITSMYMKHEVSDKYGEIYVTSKCVASQIKDTTQEVLNHVGRLASMYPSPETTELFGRIVYKMIDVEERFGTMEIAFRYVDSLVDLMEQLFVEVTNSKKAEMGM